MQPRRFFLAVGTLLALAVAPHARDARADDDDSTDLSIRTLSARADRVSGDDDTIRKPLANAMVFSASNSSGGTNRSTG